VRAALGRRGLAPAVVCLLGGLAVLLVAVHVFPHHSLNDDEGVYLTQAAMLAEGHLYLRPGPLAGLVRPWFFVATERTGDLALYSKYTPPTAALYAPFVALGVPRLALGLVGAGVAGATYGLAARAFDRRTGVVAGLLLVGSPLYLFTTGAFLSYAPATLLNGGFALAYLRATAEGSRRWAALAGLLVGLAFFTRPYTAVLFALPFVGHALWTLWRAGGRAERLVPLVVAAGGLVGVAATLGYNAVVTGAPLTFPYQAFAPADGLGFGQHRLLDYEETYTPALAARTTAENLDLLARFVALGPLGVLVAVVGAVLALRKDGDRPTVLLLAAVVPCVVLGEAYFWGTLNGLRNGLFDLLGPYYHYDLLLPFAVFGAHALVRGGDRVRARAAALDRSRARVALAVLLVLAVPVAGFAEYRAVAEPYDLNRERTEDLAAAYEPTLDREFEDALVFHPTPYGEWSAHPFQRFRNGPGFDGSTVYVFDEGPADDWRAVDATDRRPYRYTYRGTWGPGPGDPVDPALVPLRVLSGPVNATTTLGVPRGATSASVRVETREGYARYRLPADGETVVDWHVGDRVRVHGAEVRGGSPPAVPPGASEVDLAVTYATRSGATVTYRQEVTVDREGGAIRVLWPPETRVCRLRTECGPESTWVGPGADYLAGVSVETTARETA
jgi:hypothetical protein